MTDLTLLEQVLFFSRVAVGSVTALSILLTKRDPVACLGWLLSVATFPILGSIAYIIGGLNPYEAYTKKLRERIQKQLGASGEISQKEKLNAIRTNQLALDRSAYTGFKNAQSWVAGVNKAEFHRDVDLTLLVNSTTTYAEFEKAVLDAKEFIFVQFYQILPDRVGKRFFFLLRKKAKEGVKVYVLYDAMGSHRLRRDILESVRSSGIRISNFLAMHPLKRRYQINWRNHRKILICDGKTAFVGGFNIGETYLQGNDHSMPLWKDAHFQIQGPCVETIQRVFSDDWLFATGEKIVIGALGGIQTKASYSLPSKELSDEVNPSSNFVAVIPSGPSDHRAIFHSTISAVLHAAEKRVWISTAYLVPDRLLMEAMRQAVERGVDVRIVIPKHSNHPITDFCTTSYFAEFLDLGVSVYLYGPGMCHSKLLLADEDLILTGSSNLDYRSFFLNFELDLFIRDRVLAPRIEKFLTECFEHGEVMGMNHVRPRNLFLKGARNIIRLFAPIM